MPNPHMPRLVEFAVAPELTGLAGSLAAAASATGDLGVLRTAIRAGEIVDLVAAGGSAARKLSVLRGTTMIPAAGKITAAASAFGELSVRRSILPSVGMIAAAALAAGEPKKMDGRRRARHEPS